MRDLQYEMLRIRMIEERIAIKYREQQMRCPVHLSIGQEAAAVGVSAALGPKDKVVSTHRGHAHYLAKGGSLKGLIGELYGKQSGCSRGNGGSMHLIDLGVNFFGSTSIVGGTIPVGVGLAFADKIKGEDSYTVIYIGDAAVEEGVFRESADFAALHRLRVIFACENNLYSCYTRLDQRQPDRSFGTVASAHKLGYFLARPNDCDSILEGVSLARGSGDPCFIEIPTYRYIQHCGPDVDDDLNYRPPDEVARWKALDPIKHRPEALVHEINLEIAEAFSDAELAPYPDISEMGKYTYAPA